MNVTALTCSDKGPWSLSAAEKRINAACPSANIKTNDLPVSLFVGTGV